ncbi:hypothetical protein ACKWTF_014208 [Chironomus riparius]
MAMDGAAFVLIVIYLVFYICLKICCKTDSEEDPAAQVAESPPQNQHPSGPGYIITTSTINAQSYTNNNTNGYAISGTQSNQPPAYATQAPTAPTQSPTAQQAPQSERNLTEQFDCPPSYEEAMVHMTRRQ